MRKFTANEINEIAEVFKATLEAYTSNTGGLQARTAGSTLWSPRGDQIKPRDLPLRTIIRGWGSDIFAVKTFAGWYGPRNYGIDGLGDEELVGVFESDPLCEGARVAFDPLSSSPKGVWKASSVEDFDRVLNGDRSFVFSNGTSVNFTGYPDREYGILYGDNGELVIQNDDKWWSYFRKDYVTGPEALGHLLGIDVYDAGGLGFLDDSDFPYSIELY